MAYILNIYERFYNYDQFFLLVLNILYSNMDVCYLHFNEFAIHESAAVIKLRNGTTGPKW